MEVISTDERAREYFSRLKEMLQDAGRIPQPPLESPTFGWFRTAALRRLDRGAEEYGASNYLSREVNLVDEAIEECLDVPVYAMLELAKHSPDSTDAASLGQAVYHVYRAYEALLDYKAKVSVVTVSTMANPVRHR
jgi:hypothetical protein